VSIARLSETAFGRHCTDNCLLYVHGLATTFVESLRKALSLQQSFRRPVILYSWPSGAAEEHYTRALRNLNRPVTANGLITVLVVLRREIGALRILSHSMGARLLAQALQNQLMPGSRQPLMCVFAAADMQQKQFVEHLESLGIQDSWSSSCLLLASNRDRALACSSVYHTFSEESGSRAGRCSSSYCISPQAFQFLDCSSAVGDRRYNHSYVYSSERLQFLLGFFFDQRDFSALTISRMGVFQINNDGNPRQLSWRALLDH